MDHTHTNIYPVKDQREIFLPEVWGKHYWFFLMTVALTYPDNVNVLTKRKYYDLIQNMPIFIPNAEISKNFSNMLNEYPVTPYLDNRDSFVRWMHFIHNKFNALLGKEEISLPLALEKYRAEYKPKPFIFSERIGFRKHIIFSALILTLFFLIYIYW